MGWAATRTLRAGAWLWKLEAIIRSGVGPRYAALDGGVEYTFYGVLGAADLGVLAEYQYDERGKAGPSSSDNDLFAAMRLTFNDTQSTEFLAGVVQDMDTETRFLSVEASRRLGGRWKLAVEGRLLNGAPPTDPSFVLRKDGYLETRLFFHF